MLHKQWNKNKYRRQYFVSTRWNWLHPNPLLANNGNASTCHSEVYSNYGRWICLFQRQKKTLVFLFIIVPCNKRFHVTIVSQMVNQQNLSGFIVHDLQTHCALEIVIICLHELLTLVFVHTVPSLYSWAQGKYNSALHLRFYLINFVISLLCFGPTCDSYGLCLL